MCAQNMLPKSGMYFITVQTSCSWNACMHVLYVHVLEN